MFKRIIELISDMGLAQATLEKRAKLYLLALNVLSYYIDSKFHDEAIAEIQDMFEEKLVEWEK
jgi:hypothetical protein